MNFLATGCSSMPADWIRNTKGAALPSRIGTSAASTSTQALSMPSPAKGRHQMFDRSGRGSFPAGHRGRQEHMRVSPPARMPEIDRFGEIDATKDDAGIRARRPQHHVTFGRNASRRRWRGSAI